MTCRHSNSNKYMNPNAIKDILMASFQSLRGRKQLVGFYLLNTVLEDEVWDISLKPYSCRLYRLQVPSLLYLKVVVDEGNKEWGVWDLLIGEFLQVDHFRAHETIPQGLAQGLKITILQWVFIKVSSGYTSLYGRLRVHTQSCK